MNRGPDDFREFVIFNRAQIVWLHGKAEQYTDKNLAEEVANLDQKLVGVLLPLLQSTPLIVVGYRGAEPSIMTNLLGESGDLAFKKGIYWCHRGGDLHPNVEALRKRLGSNFKLCDIDGFDELFGDLDKELARQQRNLGAPVADAKPDFDDRPMDGATLADLDLDLALHTAHQYSRKLGLREPTAATLKVFLRELGLLVDAGGIDRPSIAAVLLFGRDPQRFLPHAVLARRRLSVQNSRSTKLSSEPSTRRNSTDCFGNASAAKISMRSLSSSKDRSAVCSVTYGPIVSWCAFRTRSGTFACRTQSCPARNAGPLRY